MSRKLILYIAMSLDGYIAGKNDDIDFLSRVDVPGEDYGYGGFLANIDTVIWGRRTYEVALSFGMGLPHKDKKVYVVTRTRTGKEGHVEFHPDLLALVQQLKQGEGKDIYCDGGAQVVHTLMQHRLFDRIVVSVIPHLLGGGIRLFSEGFPEHKLKLKHSASFPSGLVQLWYDVA